MKIIFFGILIIVLLINGCSQQTPTGNVVKETVTQFVCPDGSVVSNKEDCPKIETKTVTNTNYVCADLTQVKSLNDCKTSEQKEIETSNSDLVLTINNVRTARSVGEYSLENLKADEQYLIVDFSIYNKDLEKGYEFNPNWVLVEDSKGYSYGYSWDSPQLSKYWGGIAGVTVEYNSKKSGELAFVVPKIEKQFTLIVKDFSGVKGKKTFSLN